METNPKKVIKYCPKCGSSNFLFDGVKAFNCSKCQFQFFINSAAAVAAIIVVVVIVAAAVCGDRRRLDWHARD